MRNIRHILIGLFLIIGIFSEANAQKLFHEDFESIESVDGVGSIPSVWTMYNDQNEADAGLGKYDFDTYAWRVAADENMKYAISPSFFRVEAKADRWLITPEIDLLSVSNPYLVCASKSGNNVNKDSYSILLSTSGIEKIAFMDTIGVINQEKPKWTQHVYNISEYKGKKINIAFVQNTEDQYLICLDDILVYDVKDELKAEINISLPKLAVSKEALSINCTLRNLGMQKITSAVFNYRVNGENVVKNTISDLSISTLYSESILGTALDLKPYEGQTIEIESWLSEINGTNIESAKISESITIISEANMPMRKALFEGFSSATCSPCVLTNKALHKILPSLKANERESGLVAVKYQLDFPQKGDPAVTEQTKARGDYYIINAIPTMIVGGVVLRFSNSELESELKDRVQEINSQKSEILLSPYYVLTGNKFDVIVDFYTYVPIYENCKLHIVIMEDSIHHNGAGNGEKDFFYIARSFPIGVSGESIDFNEPGKYNKRQYSYEFNGEDPKVFTNTENMTVIAFIQNTKTNEIVQAEVATPSKASDEKLSTLFEDLYISPNPSKATANISFAITQNMDIKTEVYDLSGRKIWNGNLNSYKVGSNQIELPADIKTGTYIVCLRTNLGVVKSLKWVISK